MITRTTTGLLLAFAVVGCADGEQPSPNPPPSWGVPITGGTMIVTRDGNHAIIADPDRDRVVSFDLATNTVVADIALQPNDEPGRLVEDAAGRIHIALRHGGALLTLADATSGQIAGRRPVCAEPRGVAFDSATDLVHVACTSGELVSFPAAGGTAVRALRLDRDLRDVIVSGTGLVVTRFRTAEMITLDAQGVIVTRAQPPVVKRFDFSGGGGLSSDGMIDALPTVAWKAIPLTDGRIVMSHQRQLKTVLETKTPSGYGGECGQSPVEASIAVLTPGTVTTTAPPRAAKNLVSGALPVDIALNGAGDTIAIAVAGNHTVHQFRTTTLAMEDQDTGCGGGGGGDDVGIPIDDQLGAPTAIAYAGNKLVIYYPELPAVVVHDGNSAKTATLPGGLGYDSGRNMFHTQTRVGLACASCHPEGREDGVVWDFGTQGGIRRTQNLGGHILDRSPYHWVGDEADLPKLMDDVFGIRMGGGTVTHSQKVSLGPWLDRIPAPAAVPPIDATAVARGQQLFDSSETGCVGCHNGAILTTNARVDVGTAGIFKVPSLVGVGARPPFMHTGCALTLTDRFSTVCGGGDKHGHTSQLTPAQIADLVAYLESL
jgi:mono/diheme cytochrome c family protein